MSSLADAAVQEEDAVVVDVDRRLDVVVAPGVAVPPVTARDRRPAGRTGTTGSNDPHVRGRGVRRVVDRDVRVDRLVDGALLHVREQLDDPADVQAVGPVVDRPAGVDDARGEDLMDVLVVVEREAICLRLLMHCDRRAASRDDCSAGSIRLIITAMIADHREQFDQREARPAVRAVASRCSGRSPAVTLGDVRRR